MKLIFLNSHPIQYFTPLYQYLQSKNLDFEVWYCSQSSINGSLDKGFSTRVKWDLPMLNGYRHSFFRNISRKSPSDENFWSILNLSLIKALAKTPRSIIVIPGWQFASYVLTAFVGKILGHKIAIRCEMPLNQEVYKTGLKQTLKRFCLRNFYFPLSHYFLYIGVQNRAFYKYLGTNERKLYHTPYAVDNKRFQEACAELRNMRNKIKEELGLSKDDFVILNSGKYIAKKKPIDLLKAYAKINYSKKALVFVGEGDLRPDMQAFIKDNKLEKVILTGFVNQNEISRYYSIADVFVMCSGLGETWGLSVNEAMNFRLPVIVSDICGCSSDLVTEGKNGFVFKDGDIGELALKLERLIFDDSLRKSAGEESVAVINSYSFEAIYSGLKEVVRNDP